MHSHAGAWERVKLSLNPPFEGGWGDVILQIRTADQNILT